MLYPPGTITVELHDGRSLTYDAASSPAFVVADLRRHGITATAAIKNIVHRVPMTWLELMDASPIDDAKDPE